MERLKVLTRRAAMFCAIAAVSFSLLAADSGIPGAKPIDTAVEIKSVPAGALVLMCKGEVFHEDAAMPLGKTPLMRLIPLTESGNSVRIMKAGYLPWDGKVSNASAEIEAALVPLSEDQKQALGWFLSPAFDRLTVVPQRVGIKQIGSTGDALEKSLESELFEKRFLSAFEGTIKQRFGPSADLAKPDILTTDRFWKELTSQLQGVPISTIGFTPTPRQLKFEADETASLLDLKGNVLFVRAEAHYLGKGASFARVAGPLLMAIASAGMGVASGSPVVTVYVNGPSPTSDAILVQMYLVSSATRELLWYGQVIVPQYYERERVTESAAAKAAEQIPAAFLRKP